MNYICTLCHSTCLTCFNQDFDDCLTCNSGTPYFYDVDTDSIGECLIQCPAQTYIIPINVCKDCDTTCLTCFDNAHTSCLTCDQTKLNKFFYDTNL